MSRSNPDYTKHIETYNEAIDVISQFICRLNDFKDRFQWISNETMDNADPEIEASYCLQKLSVLLATLNIYKKETEQMVSYEKPTEKTVISE